MEKEKKSETMSEEEAKETIKALISRTNKENPDSKDLALLRDAFDAAPALVLKTGNMQKIILDNITSTLCGGSAYRVEATSRYIENMKSEMGYYSSTFVEKMLIDEIVMRWLRLQDVENCHSKMLGESHTFGRGLYYEKRLHLAQKRYLKAIDTLAKVRKMIAAAQAKGAEMFKNLVDAGAKPNKT